MFEDLSVTTPPARLESTDATIDFEAQLSRLLARVPPFIRLPKPGRRCPYCQLSRTALCDLVAPTERNGGKPPVEATYQRAHRHALRGVWLIPSENLFRYLLQMSRSSAAEYREAMEHRIDGDERNGTPAVEAETRRWRSRGTPTLN